MRRRLALAASLAIAAACASTGSRPAWELPPPPIAEGSIVPQERLHRAVLENGLELLVLEDHALPYIEIGLLLRRGAELETLAQAGITSLMTEVMERGAGERDALALARAVEEIGASLSVGADWDSMSVGIGGLTEDTDRLFALLADVVLRPRFEPGEVARARAELLAGLAQQADEPDALLARQLARTLYDGHRYGTGLDGDPASVARLDARAVRALHARSFVARNAIFYAVGDLSRDEAVARVRTSFGAWQPGAVPEPGPPPPAQVPPARRVVVVDRPDLGQAQLAIAHEGIARGDERRIEATLMNTILGGGGFLSRLLTRVRAEEGLAYSIGSGFAMRRHAGPFNVSTSTRVAEAGRVVGIVLEEMERMRSAPPGADELRGLKSFSAGRFVLGLETSGAIVGSLVQLDVYGLPRDSLDTYRTRVNAVSLDDVNAAARRLLHPERAAIVAVGPAAALVSQLERFGAVEVVPP